MVTHCMQHTKPNCPWQVGAMLWAAAAMVPPPHTHRSACSPRQVSAPPIQASMHSQTDERMILSAVAPCPRPMARCMTGIRRCSANRVSWLSGWSLEEMSTMGMLQEDVWKAASKSMELICVGGQGGAGYTHAFVDRCGASPQQILDRKSVV